MTRAIGLLCLEALIATLIVVPFRSCSPENMCRTKFSYIRTVVMIPVEWDRNGSYIAMATTNLMTAQATIDQSPQNLMKRLVVETDTNAIILIFILEI